MNVEDWNCKYIEAINHAKYGIKKIQGIITAFNVNVDAVHFVKSEELKRILTDPKVLEETLRCLKSPSSKIETPGEFIAGLVSTMKVGRGCEWPIYKRDVFSVDSSQF